MLVVLTSNFMSTVSVTIVLLYGWRVPLMHSTADLSKAKDNLVLTQEATTEYVSLRCVDIKEDNCL